MGGYEIFLEFQNSIPLKSCLLIS